MNENDVKKMNSLQVLLHWLKQRRIWSALAAALLLFFDLSGIAVPDLVVQILTAMAGTLALYSYAKPKI